RARACAGRGQCADHRRLRRPRPGGHAGGHRAGARRALLLAGGRADAWHRGEGTHRRLRHRRVHARARHRRARRPHRGAAGGERDRPHRPPAPPSLRQGEMPAETVLHPPPEAVPSYSAAVEAEGFVLLAGQVANDPPNDPWVLPDDIAEQTRLAMQNLVAALSSAGLELEHVVAVRVFLTRFRRDYERMNAAYRGYFAADRLPARTCVGVTALAR